MTSKQRPPPSPSSLKATRVILPPLSSATAAISHNPNRLLDAFDTYVSNRRSGGTKPDPIDFINQHYSSESLLVSNLPEIRDAISDRMNRLDDRISSALQRQSESAEATQKHVQDAKVSVASLEKRIRQVQSKASQSEKTVREITKDMKRLDCAKRHLQRTITTLKRLHMLVHAVEGLRQACLLKPHPDYQSASHLVDATRLLLQHFDSYTQKVEQMRLLNTKVIDLQGELKFRLVRGFRLVGFGVEKTREMEKKKSKLKSLGQEESKKFQVPPMMTPTTMAGGILLIDAIGKEARIEFMTGIVQDHLVEYSRIYKPANKEQPKEKPRVSSFMAQPEIEPEGDIKPESALEFVEKRFLWFQYLLAEIQKKYPEVFPPYWNLEYHLTKNFLRRTRSHLLALFAGPTKDPDSNNATILLKALQKTIIFEKDVSSALQREYGVIFQHKSDTNNDDGRAPTLQEPVEPLLGLASSAFDKYMRPYIALEERSMDEQLVSSLEDRTVDTRGNHPVFTTSTKLFVYIKGSITRCTALTKGNTFYLLYTAFQDSLRKYSQVLSMKLPPPLAQKSIGPLNMPPVPFASKNIQDNTPLQMVSYRVPNGEEVTVCHVIGTCEYCAETVEALEDLIRDTVDDEFKSKIDMMGQQEVFHEITAKAIHILVSGMENRLDAPLKTMTSINWATFVEVGEESDYVRDMHNEIQPYVATTRGLIPKSYYQSFCDKFALGFTTTYYDSLVRLKSISEPGSQQLLLDVYNLKTLILKLPVLEKSVASTAATRKSVATGSTIAPAMYTKMVQKQFKKIELLLKMTATPINLLIDVFKDQWHGGTAHDLQQVMSLKGLQRGQQAKMFEKFGMDPVSARKGAAANVTSATIVSERFQVVQDQAKKVDMSQMKQRVNDFRNAFR
ncbi:Vps53_N-domain-containing protein [Fragilariopsis cylindrus CCMP1102]|uniref:Vps53_N-domain-containing protein n=1 Tax=Fragilariopsis cylindrus CCMP1102 TaxID=635003 RepID=A0A1E7FB78_9STRA|nr:Vps53_N-domain-containing protein [Fragilariopsis cylindrus CCMP1102]|eukprot:OEU15407.1 Vps53_N-domain-containing protein [Fragilariopsis cylindrus CCMP1102]